MMLDKWNQHHGFQIDRIAVFGARTELPARKGVLRSHIDARVDTVQQLDAAHSPVSMNDGVELDCTFNVVAERVSRISGIILRRGYGRGNRRFVVRFPQLCKADDPTAGSRSKVRHVENQRVKLLVAEDSAL